jgi:pimeloyl-ACP methyl ester carboxylesterase/DNA-binding winged helix-turn-helix (wHTH) protein
MNEPPVREVVSLADFALDTAQRELRDAAGNLMPLRPQSMAVLLHLARRLGSAVDKDELLREVWPDVVVTEDSLVKCIGEIRRALGDGEHRVVRTEPKRGYRLMATPAPASSSEAASDAPDFAQEIRYCTTADNVSIAWARSGHGLPLVRTAHWMTHLDWDWRSGVFGPRIRALAQRYCLIRYDGRSYGLSQSDAQPGTLDESVLDLEAVVDAAGLRRFALFGPSGGAAIAVRYAARHPERVTQLVTMGGFVRGSQRRGEHSWPRDRFDAFARLLEDGWGQDNDAFRQLVTSMLWPGATAVEMQSFNHLQRIASPPRSAALLMRRINESDASADLPHVRCPTLVLHSPRDARVPFDEARLIASSIPGARLQTFDSPNHTPLPSEPAYAQVMRAIEHFVLPPEAGVDATQLRVVGR